ncbi:hypothetical protein FJ987_22945 [Mesorhizobium sp. CU2]|uniref:hypothetical protein n=1 Tax=unclassified Mesorhizobium TaxID=325217 RepID=UPI00112BA92C|nr:MULTISPECIES: hypothetical protein [unclassified Mesorhizobium]TPN75967.1 hypothetical protein FJ988_28625 [Mesorhizobium sp. CU3]TPO08862.1 hypothetical protein FJ987_22945 [Mesorhizobium sp. CU2]
MTFSDGSSAKFQGERRAVGAQSAMRYWKWGAIPLCIAGLWLISPADDGDATREQLAAAQHRLAAAYAELDAMRRDTSDQLHEAADTADKQAQALKAAGQKQDALASDLETAQRAIDSFRSKATLSDEARSAVAASLARANRELEEERQRLALVQGELTQASDAGNADKARADRAEAALAGAAKARQVAEAALADQAKARQAAEAALADQAKARQLAEAALADQAKARQAAETALVDAAKARETAEAGSRQAADGLKDALKLESARAEAATRDVDSARRERDAAVKASAELTAALEQAREKVIDMAVNLTAARKAIDLVKAREERRSARIVQTPAAPAVAASSGNQPARQRVARGEARTKPRAVVQSSPKRVQVATTITLPDALLPSQPSD